MANYDGEVRIKTKVDNSEVIKLEADLESTEKKAEEAGKALDQVKLNKDTADTAQQAAAGMESLADKTSKAAAKAQELNESFKNAQIHMVDGKTYDWNENVIGEAVKNTEGLSKVADRAAESMQKLAEETREANAAAYGADVSDQWQKLQAEADEYMRVMERLDSAGQTRGDSEFDAAYKGWKKAQAALSDYKKEINSTSVETPVQSAAAVPEMNVEKQLTPIQNMLSFIKQSFQDIPILFAGIANKSTTKIQQMEEEWDNLSDKADYYKSVLQELESRGLGFGNQKYDDAYVEWQKAEQAVKDYKAQLVGAKAQQKDISTGLKNVGEEGKKAFNKMNTGARKTKSMFGTMASRMKGLLLSLLIFNWISKGFNAMVAGMKKGFENLMKYSGDYANSVQSLKNAQATLGNSFAAAFAPIVQTVIPWLVQLINTISRAMTYVAQFVAILGGKSTFTRAKQVQDAYNKSLSGTAGAAKKAAGALAKFDDLDVLQKQDSSGGGENAADMFENVPVDPKVKGWLDGIRDKLKPILDYMKELKNAFIDGFWDGLGDPSGRLETIKKGLEQIKEALLDIWNDPAVRSAADAWAKSLLYMFGSLVGSIASIGLTIAAAFVGGLGEYLENNTGRIKDFLVSVFNIGTEINNLLSELFQSIAYIFEAFASESGIRFVSALIGVFADAGMGLLEVALKLGRDILNMLIQPIVENQEGFRTALEGLLSGAATILEGLKTSIDSIFDNLNAVYDAHFKPFFDSIAAGLTSIVNTILTVWNGNIQPIIDRISQKISELLTQYITPFVNNVVEFIGQIATHLQNFWELFLQPLVEWFISFAVPILSEAISLIIEVIIKVVEEIMADLNGLMEFINDTVMPAWNGFWESAGDMFDAFWQAIKCLSELLM